MYRWRQMSTEERHAVFSERRFNRRSWHGPTHLSDASGAFLFTAACYEHKPIIGRSIDRMSAFSNAVLDCCDRSGARVMAWVVLPNHYHILATVSDIQSSLWEFGRLHGRTSFQWNGEDNSRGRKVWHRCTETAMKSERHFQATLLYLLHNPVRHSYVERWRDWPFSNAHQWLEATGELRARELWKEFPLGDYGKDWDPPEL